MTVDRGRQLAHPRARVLHDERGEPGGGDALGAARVGEHGDGAEADRLVHEVGAVQTGTGQGGVHVAGADGPRVMGDARDPSGAPRLFGTHLAGELREGCGGDLDRPGRSRICHGNVLLGGLGLISVWHGGERTGRTPAGAKEEPARSAVRHGWWWHTGGRGFVRAGL